MDRAMLGRMFEDERSLPTIKERPTASRIEREFNRPLWRLSRTGSDIKVHNIAEIFVSSSSDSQRLWTYLSNLARITGTRHISSSLNYYHTDATVWNRTTKLLACCFMARHGLHSRIKRSQTESYTRDCLAHIIVVSRNCCRRVFMSQGPSIVSHGIYWKTQVVQEVVQEVKDGELVVY